MKRISLGLLFAAAVITAGTLTGANESGGGDPVIRTIVTAVIGILVVWKIADFWKRHRDHGGRDEASPVDGTNPQI